MRIRERARDTIQRGHGINRSTQIKVNPKRKKMFIELHWASAKLYADDDTNDDRRALFSNLELRSYRENLLLLQLLTWNPTILAPLNAS